MASQLRFLTKMKSQGFLSRANMFTFLLIVITEINLHNNT